LTSHRQQRSAPVLLTLALLLASCSGYGKPSNPATEMAFGTDMAKRGLWNEAMFRFREAERADPQNPRVQNNLGVAYEAQGDFDKALDHYKKALQLAPNDKQVRANYARFVEFYQGFKSPEKGKGKSAVSRNFGKPGAASGEGNAGATPPAASGPAEPANTPARPGQAAPPQAPPGPAAPAPPAPIASPQSPPTPDMPPPGAPPPPPPFQPGSRA
jgi:hypothetical protein